MNLLPVQDILHLNLEVWCNVLGSRYICNVFYPKMYSINGENCWKSVFRFCIVSFNRSTELTWIPYSADTAFNRRTTKKRFGTILKKCNPNLKDKVQDERTSATKTGELAKNYMGFDSLEIK